MQFSCLTVFCDSYSPWRLQVAALERLRLSFGAAVFDRSMWDFSMSRSQSDQNDQSNVAMCRSILSSSCSGSHVCDLE